MAEPVPLSSTHDTPETSNFSETATFEKLQGLLKARDDTSRFVGLALLKSVLDDGILPQNQEQVRLLWELLSPKFLDRLLKAGQSQKTKKEDAKDMVDLAVAVLHTFTIILPEDLRRDSRLIGRAKPLINALLQSSPKTTTLILQTILTFVSQTEGALTILDIEDISPLTEISDHQPLVLDILCFMWINASASLEKAPDVATSMNKLIPNLLVIFKETDAVTFLRMMGTCITKIMPEALPQNPKWLKKLITVLRDLAQKRPTAAGRAAYTQLAAALLQAYPAVTPSLLFKSSGSRDPESKPFAYLFVNLIMIDIRSSFPSLLSRLNDPEYPFIAERLSAGFDVLSAFIGFLVKSLEDEEEDESFDVAPDLLLKLRKDIAETVSLTIEYFRDRWDASIAGASGLHPTVRSGTSTTSEGTRLTLTWESMKDKVHKDPLILAGIRTLAIWIREDENENLRNESAGLMDMFMELYKSSSHEGLDFRYPILTALEAIMETDEDGVSQFNGQSGWNIVFADLTSIVMETNDQPGSVDLMTLKRGIEIVRTLLSVVDHISITYPEEEWMKAVTVTASMKAPAVASKPHPLLVEFQIAMLQLATALISKAPAGMQKRYLSSAIASRGFESQLEDIVKAMEDTDLSAEFMSELEEVRNLGFSSLP